MIQKISLILAVATTLLLSSCKKDEPYDHPFIYVIQADDDAYAATSTVSSQATVVRTYNCLLYTSDAADE